MSRRLLLVRHGVTTWNREGRFQGHLDPPLHEAGELEARLVAARLAAEEMAPLRIVSSPLRRAMATARMVADAMAAAGRPTEVVSEPRLMEIGQGDWEGRTHHELEADDPQRYAAWRSDGGATQPPGGEPLDGAQMRVAAAADELTGQDRATVCLVSHGGILRLAARHFLGLALERAWALDLDNAALSIMSWQDDGPGWRLDAWNDTAHLLGRTTLHQDEAEGAPLAL